MKKTILLLGCLVLLGAACSKDPSVSNQPTSPVLVTDGTSATENRGPQPKESLDYYIQNSVQAPEAGAEQFLETEGLVLAFSVLLNPISCNPNGEDEYSLCCDATSKTFIPEARFYTWRSTAWQQGGSVEFYIDNSHRVCEDTGTLVPQGPFNDDLRLLSQENK